MRAFLFLLLLAEIAPGVYVRQGVHEDASAANLDAIANVGFVVGKKSVAVIDPGGSLADGEQLRARIRKVTPLPIRYVVLMHGHPDHIFGAAAFVPDTPEFVGHERLPQSLAQRGEYYRKRLADVLGKDAAGSVIAPTLLVRDSIEIDLGGRVLDISAHGIAHTDSDLTVIDRTTGTLFLSDLLFVDRVPALDGSLPGWLKMLQGLKTVAAKRAVPGHGPPSVPWPAAAANEERYLKVLLDETRAALARRIELEGAVTTVGTTERGKWQLFDEYHGRNVTQAYKELEWE